MPDPAGPSGHRRFATAEPEEREVEDLFLGRTVDFSFHKTTTTFDLARSVFSSASVDAGSQLLLRHLQAVLTEDHLRILDLGCGHGTLGIVLQALDRRRQVTFVDRDALACGYTARNLERNGVDLATAPVLGGLGPGVAVESDDGRPFDLVVCNLPGKAGEAAIRHLAVASARAAAGGLVGFVIVAPLAELLDETVAATGIDVVLDRSNRAHRVVIGRAPVEAAAMPGSAGSGGGSIADGFDAGVFDRTTTVFDSPAGRWEATTVHGIDEFDSLAQGTRMLRTALQGLRSTPSLIVNPGQGHRAVVAARAGYGPQRLLSRDLLALRASERLLRSALPDCAGDGPADDAASGQEREAAGSVGIDLVHGIGIDEAALDGVGVTILHGEAKVHPPWLAGQVQRWLTLIAGGAGVGTTGGATSSLVLSGRPSVLGRIEADVLGRGPGRIVHKRTVKGHRVLRYDVRS